MIEKLNDLKYSDKLSRDNIEEEMNNKKLLATLNRRKEIAERCSEISKEIDQVSLSKEDKDKLSEELHELINEGHENFKEIKRLSALVDMMEKI